MKLIPTLLTATSLMAASGASAATYECKMNNPSRNSVISPEITITVAGDGSAEVTDRFSKRYGRAPVTARFVQDTSKQLRVRWRLEDVVNSRGQKATLDWSLVYKKNRGKAHVTFNAHGFDNTNAGNGTCQQVK